MSDNGKKIPGGYVLIARKMAGSELMDKPPHYMKLWVWMLMQANWKDRDKLNRGQFVTTIAEMQKAGGYKVGFRQRTLTIDEVRSALDFFRGVQKTDSLPEQRVNGHEAAMKPTMITTTKTTRGLIITICNYEYYQEPKNYEAHNVPHDEDAMKPTATPHDTEEGLKKVKKEEEKNIKPLVPNALRLSGRLAELILQNLPNFRELNNGKKEATIQRWHDDIEKMNRIDKRSWEEIEAMVEWCQRDDFWRGNILSGGKLREKYDKMFMKMTAVKKGGNRDEERAAWEKRFLEGDE